MHLVYQEEKQILLIFVALSVLVKVVIKVVGLGASSCFSHDLHVFVVLQLENRKKKKPQTQTPNRWLKRRSTKDPGTQQTSQAATNYMLFFSFRLVQFSFWYWSDEALQMLLKSCLADHLRLTLADVLDSKIRQWQHSGEFLYFTYSSFHFSNSHTLLALNGVIMKEHQMNLP